MTFKNRAFGVLAALVVMLGLSASAGAQSQTDTETVQAELTDGICNIDLTVDAGTGLGAWDWDGTTWLETSGNATVKMTGTFIVRPIAGCNVTVEFNGLELVGGAGERIDATHFSAFAYFSNAAQDPAGWTDTNVTASNYNFSLTLDSVPTTVPEGTYAGRCGSLSPTPHRPDGLGVPGHLKGVSIMFGRASGLGLCLAIVLMLAVSGGAVAQETTDSDGVYTALVNEPCGIDIDHTYGTFGTWQWDGTKYAVPPTRST